MYTVLSLKYILSKLFVYRKNLPKMTNLKNCFQDKLSLNAGQKYCRMPQGEHSAILLIGYILILSRPGIDRIFVFQLLHLELIFYLISVK